MTGKLKRGSYMALFTIAVIAAIIVASLIIERIPAKYRKWDLSTNQILTLGDTTEDILSKLDRDVTIRITASPNPVDERIRSFASLYADQSPRIHVVEDDPVLHSDVLTALDVRPGQVLMVYEGTGKKTAVSFNDIIQTDLTAYYQYQQIKETAFDGEGQITSTASYMTSDNEIAMYTLIGYQEPVLSTTVKDALKKSSMMLSDPDLITDSTIPQDYSLLITNNPQVDISQDETTAPIDCLKNGGHLPLLSGATQNRLVSLSGLRSQYEMDIRNEFMASSAPRYFYNNNPSYVIPEYDFSSGSLSEVDSKQIALATQLLDMIIQEDLRGGLTITPFLTTLDFGILVDPATQERTEGTYILTAVAVETINKGENTASVFAVIAAPELISNDILTSFPNITSLIIFMDTVSYGMPGATTLSIPNKSLDIAYNMITLGGSWSALLIIVIPAVFLITGFMVWMKHRKL